MKPDGKTYLIQDYNDNIMGKRKRTFDILIEKGEDGYYIASVPSLPGCHTQAKSLDALMRRIQDAIRLYLEARKDRADIKSRFVGIQRIEVAL
jgi:predicted RNase H-like HicB family nuclease